MEDDGKKELSNTYSVSPKTNSAGIEDMVRLHLSKRHDYFSSELLLAILVHS